MSRAWLSYATNSGRNSVRPTPSRPFKGRGAHGPPSDCRLRRMIEELFRLLDNSSGKTAVVPYMGLMALFSVGLSYLAYATPGFELVALRCSQMEGIPVHIGWIAELHGE